MPDDGLRRELVRGRLRIMEPSGFDHGCVAMRIGHFLYSHASETASGVAVAAETGFLLSSDPDTVRAPDAAFISKARLQAVGSTTKYWPGAPDLAVEVISPNDSFQEVEEKALEWLAAGSIAVLVLDPARHTATVYRGQGDAHAHSSQDTLDLSDAVPGLRMAVAALFA